MNLNAARAAFRRRAYLVQYSPAPILDPASGEPKHFATPVRDPRREAPQREAPQREAPQP